MGLKPSDYRTIPLVWALHDRLHNQGEASFYDEYRVNPDELIVKYLTKYLTEKGESKRTVDALEQIVLEIG
jgi:hypothetical protein